MESRDLEDFSEEEGLGSGLKEWLETDRSRNDVEYCRQLPTEQFHCANRGENPIGQIDWGMFFQMWVQRWASEDCREE